MPTTLDSVVACPHCRAVAYRIWRTPHVEPDGTERVAHFHTVEKVSQDQPDLPRGQNLACRDCGTEFRRDGPR